jgi:hypothetical protein
MFIHQSDHCQCGKLSAYLENSFTRGNDDCPDNLVSAYHLINGCECCYKHLNLLALLLRRTLEKEKTSQARTRTTRGRPKPLVTTVTSFDTSVSIFPSSKMMTTRKCMTTNLILFPRAPSKTVSLSMTMTTRRSRRLLSLSSRLRRNLRRVRKSICQFWIQ